MRDLLSEFGFVNAEPEKKEKTKPLAVSIAHRCERCGVIFARSHPKDPQRYCERCRNDNEE